MEHFLQQWFSYYEKGVGVKADALNCQILSEWQQLLEQVKSGELDHWKRTPPGRLALILLMGPVTHLLADSSSMSLQLQARELCISGIDKGFDTQLDSLQRRCFYDPLFYSSKVEDKTLLLCLLEGMQSQVELSIKPVWQHWYHQATKIENLYGISARA